MQFSKDPYFWKLIIWNFEFVEKTEVLLSQSQKKWGYCIFLTQLCRVLESYTPENKRLLKESGEVVKVNRLSNERVESSQRRLNQSPDHSYDI